MWNARAAGYHSQGPTLELAHTSTVSQGLCTPLATIKPSVGTT